MIRRTVQIAVGLLVTIVATGCVSPKTDAPATDVGNFGASPTVPESTERDVLLVRVVRVVDGDTVTMDVGGQEETVRLIGIDTPESVHPTVEDECFGKAASKYAASQLEGKTVELGFDVEKRDFYGRLLGYVWTDGDLFNVRIVEDGYAAAYTVPPNVEFADEIVRAQRSARKAGRGLWGKCRGKPRDPPAEAKRRQCTAGYKPCLPPAADYDCLGGGGDGPRFAKGPIRVSGKDPYRLDEDGDGFACADS